MGFRWFAGGAWHRLDYFPVTVGSHFTHFRVTLFAFGGKFGSISVRFAFDFWINFGSVSVDLQEMYRTQAFPMGFRWFAGGAWHRLDYFPVTLGSHFTHFRVALFAFRGHVRVNFGSVCVRFLDKLRLSFGGFAGNAQNPSISNGFSMVCWRRVASSGLLSGHLRVTVSSFLPYRFAFLE
jgi:hypothetical protein